MKSVMKSRILQALARARASHESSWRSRLPGFHGRM